jgi:sugar transferase (PEP-CTERM system associated)
VRGKPPEQSGADEGVKMVRLFGHYVSGWTLLQVLTDGALFYGALLLAALIQVAPYGIDPAHLTGPAVAFAVLMTLTNAAFGQYRRNLSQTLNAVLGRALLVVALCLPLVLLAFAALPAGDVASKLVPYAILYSLFGVILTRLFTRGLRSLRSASRRVLIVGCGPDARDVQAALHGLGYPAEAVLGFYRVDPEASVLTNADRQFDRRESLLALAKQQRVREIIVAVREQRGGVLPLRELLDCRVNGIRVCDLSAFYERLRGEVPIESLKASWLIYGQGFAQDRLRAAVKRAFDILAAAVLLMLAAPLMLLTALAIAAESGLPVVYRQVRVGCGGRTFTCLKFRSMARDAERDGVARWAVAGDTRITRVGRFIRKTRIDELPQLWNVLVGDMSLVGPRPERPGFVESLKEQIRFYDVRHSVKPGLTGWAQVRYSYGASVDDARRKLEYDLYYVKNHSLFLDCLILVETVRVVLFGEGAR